MPIGYADKNSILSNKLKIIYAPELYLFALLSSKMHNIWIDSIGGKYGPSFIYSTRIIYNNFPVPSIKEEEKIELKKLSNELLDLRNKFFDKNIAYLYNNETMPNSLKKIHNKIDDLVDKVYANKIFERSGQTFIPIQNVC